MASVDEDLKTFLQASASLAAAVGSRIHENRVPMAIDPATGVPDISTAETPFIWFAGGPDIRDDCINETAGDDPLGYTFQLQVVAETLRDMRTIAGYCAALHNSRGTFGSRTVQRVTIEDQQDDFQDHLGAVEAGFHTSGFNVGVYVL